MHRRLDWKWVAHVCLERAASLLRRLVLPLWKGTDSVTSTPVRRATRLTQCGSPRVVELQVSRNACW